MRFLSLLDLTPRRWQPMGQRRYRNGDQLGFLANSEVRT